MPYNITTNTRTSHQRDVEVWVPDVIGEYVEGVFEGCGYEYLPSSYTEDRSVTILLSKKEEKKKILPIYVRTYCLYLYRKGEPTDLIIPDRHILFGIKQVLNNGDACRLQLSEIKDQNKHIYRIFKKEEEAMGALSEKLLPELTGNSTYASSGGISWIKINGKTGECGQKSGDLTEVITGGWVFQLESLTYDYTETYKGSGENCHQLNFKFRDDIEDKESTLFILQKRVDQNLTIRLLRLLYNADLSKPIYLDARMNGKFVEPIMAQQDAKGQWKPVTMAFEAKEVPKAEEEVIKGQKFRDTIELTKWGVDLASKISERIGGATFQVIDPETVDFQ